MRLYYNLIVEDKAVSLALVCISVGYPLILHRMMTSMCIRFLFESPYFCHAFSMTMFIHCNNKTIFSTVLAVEYFMMLKKGEGVGYSGAMMTSCGKIICGWSLIRNKRAQRDMITLKKFVQLQAMLLVSIDCCMQWEPG